MLAILDERRNRSIETIAARFKELLFRVKNSITVKSLITQYTSKAKVKVLPNQRTTTRALLRQYTAASISSIAALVKGTMAAWPSPVLPRMERSSDPMWLTTSEVSWLVSLIYLGNFISPLPAGWLTDKIGRKSLLLLTSVFSISAWLLIYFAKNVYMLWTARVLSGVWIGVVNTVLPMYLAEISEAKRRGSISTLYQLIGNIGVVFVLAIGPRVSYYTLAVICGCIPFIFLLTFPFMPESPFWHLMIGDKERAAKGYKWLRNKANWHQQMSQEMDSNQNRILEGINKKFTKHDSLFKNRSNRKALIIMVTLAAFQRFSGVSVITAFASTTLPTKESSALSVHDSILVLGMLSVVGALVQAFIVDMAGRKILLIISSIGCGIAMIVAGVWFFLHEKTGVDVSHIYYIPFTTFLFYNVFYSFGLGPIVSTIQGEIFPPHIKGLASGITAEVLALSSFICNKIYRPVGKKVGFYLLHLVFGVDCFLTAIFTFFFVIETKQKALAQIQEELSK